MMVQLVNLTRTVLVTLDLDCDCEDEPRVNDAQIARRPSSDDVWSPPARLEVEYVE